MGDGNDSFIWNPGDGSGTVEGQGGLDTLQFNGASVGKGFELSASGDHARLVRDVRNVTIDRHGIEHVALAATGGADGITVHDLTGTDLSQIDIDLAGSGGGARRVLRQDKPAGGVVPRGAHAGAPRHVQESDAIYCLRPR